ncbi:hypothetical protein [Nocardia suismassiliense]|uniref:hypothetical protein n=1 Tax=Nocardia suismassiliense TaxID=2077092 RepID=UPI000D1E8B2A|nr:hypothetical protein [Nocardia suismassiliense]
MDSRTEDRARAALARISEIADLWRAAGAAWRAAADTVSAAAELEPIWAAAEPEARAGLLHAAAWAARETALPADDDPDTATLYAIELHRYARAIDDPAEHYGQKFPDMPLAGSGGVLASSLAFDRDDLTINAHTAVQLVAAAARAASAARALVPLREVSGDPGFRMELGGGSAVTGASWFYLYPDGHHHGVCAATIFVPAILQPEPGGPQLCPCARRAGHDPHLSHCADTGDYQDATLLEWTTSGGGALEIRPGEPAAEHPATTTDLVFYGLADDLVKVRGGQDAEFIAPAGGWTGYVVAPDDSRMSVHASFTAQGWEFTTDDPTSAWPVRIGRRVDYMTGPRLRDPDWLARHSNDPALILTAPAGSLTQQHPPRGEPKPPPQPNIPATAGGNTTRCQTKQSPPHKSRDPKTKPPSD